MNRFTRYCSEEQTKKAFTLGVPLIKCDSRDKHMIYWGHMCYPRLTDYPYAIPTVEQMIGFLRGKGIKFHFDDETDYWRIDCSMLPLSDAYGVSEQKELAAIDAALDYLIKNKK